MNKVTRYIIIYILLSSINSVWLIYGISNSIIKWIIISISIKLGIYPNNHYIINFYRSISILKVILISTIPKIWIIYLISEIYLEIILNNKNILLIISIISIIIGTINVINNIELKSILGNSSIITMGIIINLLWLNKEWYSLYYIEIYSIFNLLLLIGLIYSKNIIILFIIYNFLGLPPLLGFIIKYEYLSLLLHCNIILTIFIYITITISSYMYLRLIERIISLSLRSQNINLKIYIFLFIDLL